MAEGIARRSTSYDVARLAGVSQSAVSRCFRAGASVAPATRAAVLRAAAALGYAPNQMARSLITRRSRIMGVLISEATTESYPGLLLHLGREIQAAGHRMLVFLQPPGGDPRPALPDILGYHVDAVLGCVAMPDAMIAACAAQNVPVVLYNHASRHPWASSVGCDDAAGMAALAAHLRAKGCRTLHIIAGAAGTPVGESRRQAALLAMAAEGLAVQATAHADYSYAGGRAAAVALLGAEPKADALVCANDGMALGALDACRYDLGRRVPQDILVTGYDDVPEGGRPGYGLTTLAQPIGALTRGALRMACDRLAGTAEPGERRLLPVRLVVRGSTGVAG